MSLPQPIAAVHLIGKLQRERSGVLAGPTRATLDFSCGETKGQIQILATQSDMADAVTAIGDDSIVEVKGRLRHHRWLTGGAVPRETFQVEVEQIEVLVDARRQGRFE